MMAFNKCGKRNVIGDGEKILTKYNIQVRLEDDEAVVETAAYGKERYTDATQLKRRLRRLMEDEWQGKLFEEWRTKPLARRILWPELDLITSFYWLRKGMLSAVVMRNAIAVQEGCLNVRAAHWRGEVDDEGKLCRRCYRAPETAEHILSQCSHWSKTLYLD